MRRTGPFPWNNLLSHSLALVLLSLGVIPGAVRRAFSQFPTQRPAGYVSDFAGVLNPQGWQRLEALSKELDEKTHAQLAIVTVKSLQGRPIEDFSIDLATKWGIGYKGGPRDEKADQGILLLLAIEDRQDRIEVGYGLEPIITDGRSGSILRAMTPALRNGDYDGALWLGAASIAQPIAQAAGISLATLAAGPRILAPSGEEPGQGSPITLWNFISIFFFAILFLVLLSRRWGRRFGGPGGTYGGWGVGGMGGGWSGGGGGGGFGGFGGGSFGGGGASGSW